MRLVAILAALLLVASAGAGKSFEAAEAKFESAKAKAEQGDGESQAILGARYASGNGVPQDHGEAAKWYRKAAEQGIALALIDVNRSCRSAATILAAVVSSPIH